MGSSEAASNHIKKRDHNHALNEFFKSCSDFRKTDTFIEAMQFVARFTHYAPLNAFLIYTQRPTASFVATRSRWWVQFRRRLKERARPIVILAPMGPVAFVYDLEDTDGKRIPEYYAEPYEVKGELAQEKWDNALLHCIEVDQFKIAYTEKSYLNAACAIRRGDHYTIEINRDFDDQRYKFSFLAHELAHIYCGHLGADDKHEKKKQRWDDRRHLTKSQMEIEAETIAYLVCSRCGLETKAMEYVAGYLRYPEEDLGAISVKVILDIKRKIEI
jgi:hypothetical protein